MGHTPGPWGLEQTTHAVSPVIMGESPFTGGPRRIARVLYEVGSEDPEVWANARRIVTAVNSFDALVAACDNAQAALQRHCDDACKDDRCDACGHGSILRQVKAAIAKAKEGSR